MCKTITEVEKELIENLTSYRKILEEMMYDKEWGLAYREQLMKVFTMALEFQARIINLDN